MWSFALEAGRFPAVHFAVTRVEGEVRGLQSGMGTGDVQLHGRLTVRDVTRDVVVPVRWTWEGPILRFHGRYDLRWADYGVPDASIVVSTLSPDMYVAFDLVGRR
jgi:polyisoprenoid-binding protein YceI